MNVKNRIEVFNYLTRTQIFKAVLLLIIIVVFYSIAVFGFSADYKTTFFTIITNFNFWIITILILFLTTFSTYNILNKNRNFLIRYQLKQIYFRELFKQIIFNNTIIFLMIISLLLIGLNIFSPIVSVKIIEYSIPDFVYFIYFLLRAYIVISIVLILSVLLFKVINEYILIIINMILFLISGFIFGMNEKAIDSIFQVPIFYSQYLGCVKFSSFLLDFSMSLLYIFVGLIIIYLVYKKIINRKFDIE